VRPDSLTDEELMTRVSQDSDREAYGELYSRYRDYLTREYARERPERHEDLIQITLMRVWQYRDSYDPDMGMAVSSWIYTIAQREHIRMHRKGSAESKPEVVDYRNRDDWTDFNPGVASFQHDGHMDPKYLADHLGVDDAVDHLRRGRLVQAIAQLEEPKRKMAWYLIGGYETNDIMQCEGMQLQAVQRLREETVAALKEVLNSK
jgi:RNA polymerase sigma factor (sigma-70 family)